MSENTESRKCSCGHDRHHARVKAECEYTAMGKFWVMLFGVSTEPIKVKYRCRICSEVFDETTDPAILKKHM